MKLIKYLIYGAIFGIIMTKSEAISWYRIQEMFLFHSFHMYGIILTAVAFGTLFVFLIKRFNMKDLDGNEIQIMPKQMGFKRYLFGGAIFGIGWSLTGACPGPLYVLIGNGYLSFIFVIICAIFGTFLYGVVRDKLPH